MEKLLSSLTILAMINIGYMADPNQTPEHNEAEEDQRILDVYHGTSPLRRDHVHRMRTQLSDLVVSRSDNKEKTGLRKHAKYLIWRKCREWEKITGWNQEKTDKQLAWIYRDIMTDEPDQEGKMRERLKSYNPLFREIDPEIIRSVVHNWYRRYTKAGRYIPTPQQKTALNQEILAAYHATNPFMLGQEQRMEDTLNKRETVIRVPSTIRLRKHAQSLIQKMCNEWRQITGWNQQETDERLSKIYPITKIDLPVDEAKVREKLLAAYPPFWGMNPEIIRSVVHDWNTRLVQEMKRSVLLSEREYEADLLHTYNRIRVGIGSIHDRLAKKWKLLHPEVKDYSKYTLLDRAYYLTYDRNRFNSKEMKAAKERYDRVFGSERKFVSGDKARVKWGKDQKIDLVHLYNLFHTGKLVAKNFENFWRIMHPELGFLTKNSLLTQIYSMKKRKFKLSLEDEAEADTRLKTALSRERKSQQNTEPLNRGKALAIPDEEQFLQRSPDAIMQPHSRHAGHDFIDEDREYSRTLMKNGTSNYPPTPRFPHLSYHHGRYSFNELSRAPRETSFSHVNSSSINPLAANPYYEHGSSSHDPHTANPYYEHGSSSDSRDDYHPS